MGKGNPNRRGKIARGTANAYRAARFGIEGEPDSPVIFPPEEKKPKSKVIDFKKRSPEERKPAGVETPGGKSASDFHSGPKASGSITYRTGPTIETALRRPTEGNNPEEKEAIAEEVDSNKQPFESISNWRAEMVRKSAGDFAKDFFNKDYLKVLLRRWPQGRNLTEEKIEALAKKIETDRDAVAESVSEKVYDNLSNPETGKKYKEERNGLFLQDIVDDRVFIEMRSAIFKLAEKYILEKIESEPEKEPAEAKEDASAEKGESFDFTQEQSSKLVKLIKAARQIQGEVEPAVLEEVVEAIIKEDLIAEGIFSEDDFQKAFAHVKTWLQRFNDKK